MNYPYHVLCARCNLAAVLRLQGGLRSASVARERVTHCSGVNNLHGKSWLSCREPSYRVNSTYYCMATGHHMCCPAIEEQSRENGHGNRQVRFCGTASSHRHKTSFTECLCHRNIGDGMNTSCLAVKQLVWPHLLSVSTGYRKQFFRQRYTVLSLDHRSCVCGVWIAFM